MLMVMFVIVVAMCPNRHQQYCRHSEKSKSEREREKERRTVSRAQRGHRKRVEREKLQQLRPLSCEPRRLLVLCVVGRLTSDQRQQRKETTESHWSAKRHIANPRTCERACPSPPSPIFSVLSTSALLLLAALLRVVRLWAKKAPPAKHHAASQATTPAHTRQRADEGAEGRGGTTGGSRGTGTSEQFEGIVPHWPSEWLRLGPRAGRQHQVSPARSAVAPVG